MAGVDLHQHLWPPSFVEALRRRRSAPRLEGDVLALGEGAYRFDARDHELGARLALLDAAALDVAVVSLQPTLGLQALEPDERDELELTWEEGILQLAAQAGGRIVPLSPRRPAAGFAGASVGADAFDDLDGLAPTLDALRGSGLLFVHPVAGAPRAGAPGWWPAVAEYTGQMQRAFLAWLAHGQDRWPDVRLVFAILAGGAPVQLERLGSRGADPVALRHPNLFLDTASYGPRALRLCADALGAEQLVFGSDVPVLDASRAAACLAALGPDVESLARERTPGRLLARAAADHGD